MWIPTMNASSLPEMPKTNFRTSMLSGMIQTLWGTCGVVPCQSYLHRGWIHLPQIPQREHHRRDQTNRVEVGSSTWHQQMVSTTNWHHIHLPNESFQTTQSKGFSDALTIISASSSDHSEALKGISSSCNDLDLTLKPLKCISFVYDGKKMNKSGTLWSSQGSPETSLQDQLNS